MANKRANQLNVEEPEYRPSMPDALLPVSRPAGEAGEVLYKVGDELATKAGKIADDFAKIEGERAGKIAGLDEKWRPSDSTTLRGRAFEEAATTTYTNMLEANLDRDMRTAAVELRDSPGALTKKLDEIKADYVQRHVFPQIRGQFETRFERTRTFLTVDSLQLQKTRTEEASRASSIPLRRALDNEQADIDDMPDGPEKEKLRKENDARRRQSYENDVKNGGSAVAATEGYQRDIENNEIRRVTRPLLRIEDPEAYRVAAQAALEKARKTGRLGADTIEKIEAEIERGARVRESRTETSEAKVQNSVDAIKQRSSEGVIVPEAERRTLLATAKTAKEQQIVRDGLAHADALARHAHKTPAELEAEATALRAKIEASKGGTKEEAEQLANIEKVKASKERKIAVGEEAIKKGVEGWEDRGLAGTAIPPAEIEAAKRAAKTDREKAIVEAAAVRAENLRKMSTMTPAELDAEARKIRTKGLEQRGQNAADAALLVDIEKVKKERQKILTTDPVGDAARDGKVVVQPLNLSLAASPEPAHQAMLEQQLRERAPMKAYTQRVGAPDLKLTETERAQAKIIYSRGGKPAQNLVMAIVGAYGDKAPALLEEIGGQEMLGVGGLAIMPGPSRKSVVAEAVDGVAHLKNEDLKGKLPKVPTNADALFDAEFGTTMTGPQKANIMRTATQIYTSRAYRANVGKDDDDEAKKIFSGALRAAAGQVSNSKGDAFGGPVKYTAGGSWVPFSGASSRVIAPPNIKANKFRDVVDSLKDEDLGGATHADGKPIRASDLKAATPVKVEGGHIFVLGDPGSPEARKVIGGDGKELVIDFTNDNLVRKLENRVPGAFR
jgi:hypothetical protein